MDLKVETRGCQRKLIVGPASNFVCIVVVLAVIVQVAAGDNSFIPASPWRVR